jgi:hypothetical protein
MRSFIIMNNNIIIYQCKEAIFTKTITEAILRRDACVFYLAMFTMLSARI